MDDIVTIRRIAACRSEGAKPHHIVKIASSHHEVEVTFSPTGRAVHVWIDGEYVEARRG